MKYHSGILRNGQKMRMKVVTFKMSQEDIEQLDSVVEILQKIGRIDCTRSSFIKEAINEYAFSCLVKLKERKK